MEIYSRTKAIIGEHGFNMLRRSHIVICGCGGVGSYTFEALLRSGIGKITLIDGDYVAKSNINRQLIATTDTVGIKKTEAAMLRANQIGGETELCFIDQFITKDNANDILPKNANFIVDAIDDVSAKTAIAIFAKSYSIPSICCLGTGNRLDATKFEICDLYKTSGCPLARKIRYEFKKAGIDRQTVLYSKAPTVIPDTDFTDGKRTVGSISYVPSVAGLLLAQHVILKITEEIK